MCGRVAAGCAGVSRGRPGCGADGRYVHQEILGRSSLLSQPRVRLAWAIVLARHPLLAARIQARSYTQTSFLHASPGSLDLALARADQQLTFLPGSATELVDAFLHGPRTLNADTSAVLVVRTLPGAGTERTYELLLCAAPYACTAAGLHAVMGELHALLRTRDLTRLLLHELAHPAPFPEALDAAPLSPLQLAVGAVLHAHDAAGPGGQVFPHGLGPARPPQPADGHGPLERVFDAETTARIHAACRRRGTEFGHVVVFLAAAAFTPQARARDCATPTRIELPTPYAYASPGAAGAAAEEVSNPVLVSQFAPLGVDAVWRRAAALTRREHERERERARARSPHHPTSVRRLAKFAAAARAGARDAVRAAQREDESNPGLGLVGFSMPHRPAPVPEGAEADVLGSEPGPSFAPVPAPSSTSTSTSTSAGLGTGVGDAGGSGGDADVRLRPPGRGGATATPLLGVQNLGALDALYAPDMDGLVDGLHVRRVAAGTRRSGVLLYCSEFAGRATLSVSADEGYAPALAPWWAELGRLVDAMFADPDPRPDEPPPALERAVAPGDGDGTAEPPAALERDAREEP